MARHKTYPLGSSDPKRAGTAGVSLLEVLIAFGLLLVAVFTMVGYTALVHRSATEGKRQALASVEARNLLERVRDHPPLFERALLEADGLQETRIEQLLPGEDGEAGEADRKAAARIRLTARAIPVTDLVFRLVVTAEWDEDGRSRRVVLESRCTAPGA